MTVLEQTFTYDDAAEKIDEVWDKVNELLEERRMLLHYVIADGKEVRDDIEQYLRDQAAELRSIDIIAVSVSDALNEIVLSASQYLERALPQLELLYREFYQKPTSDTWDKLAQWIEGLQWLYQLSEMARKFSAEELVGNFVAQMDELMPELSEALENKDPVALGDIVYHEGLPMLYGLNSSLKQFMDNKVVKPDVN